ncbi:MAG TPA: DUF3788 family protein [Thermoleophilia bacterium]
MALSAFDDVSSPPQPAAVSEVLGPSARLWDQLVSAVTESHPPTVALWNFAGVKYGWSLRLKRRDRNLLHLTPQPGTFLLGVVLGEKAALAAHRGELPKAVLKVIDEAPRYGEGRGIRMQVATTADLETARMLTALKMGR